MDVKPQDDQVVVCTEIEFKVTNHNQTVVSSRITANHNQTVVRPQPFVTLGFDPGLMTNHNQTLRVFRVAGNHNQTVVRPLLGINPNHNQTLVRG